MAVITEPGKVVLADKELAVLGNKQVLIEIKAASICGSDLHIYKGKHPSAPLPVAIGHEFSGDVIEVGDAVTRVKAGDKVTVEPVLVCGHCPPCQEGKYGYCDNISYHYRKGQGAFARYFIADERFVYPLPSGLSYQEGALIEPLAVAVHAVKRAKIGLGDQVLILGAGAIGLLIGALCKAAGATEIITVDLADYRLEMAKTMGATRVVNPLTESLEKAVSDISRGRGLGKTFECVGMEKTLVQAMSFLCIGGEATVVGIFEQPQVVIPASLFVSREITVRGSQGYCWDFETALALSLQINLKQLVTHEFPLEKVNDAFVHALDPACKAVKVQLNP